jgi:hypothetical protein
MPVPPDNFSKLTMPTAWRHGAIYGGTFLLGFYGLLVGTKVFWRPCSARPGTGSACRGTEVC